ncbi:hypothetical protein BDR26DRAFT_726493 [Obelidium mucronatum]|nr:hypothetical protein BDR26DRAFT_726493 [Obelidium mucronatum]
MNFLRIAALLPLGLAAPLNNWNDWGDDDDDEETTTTTARRRTQTTAPPASTQKPAPTQVAPPVVVDPVPAPPAPVAPADPVPPVPQEGNGSQQQEQQAAAATTTTSPRHYPVRPSGNYQCCSCCRHCAAIGFPFAFAKPHSRNHRHIICPISLDPLYWCDKRTCHCGLCSRRSHWCCFVQTNLQKKKAVGGPSYGWLTKSFYFFSRAVFRYASLESAK